jgi:hypothetical protein
MSKAATAGWSAERTASQVFKAKGLPFFAEYLQWFDWLNEALRTGSASDIRADWHRRKAAAECNPFAAGPGPD